MSTPGSPLSKASNDANQSMSPSPAGSPSSSCGSSPDSSSEQSPQTISPEKKHWVAVQLVDENDRPVPGEDYQITLPDGSVIEGSLDSKGKARIEGIDDGTCKVTFPNRDTDCWKQR